MKFKSQLFELDSQCLELIINGEPIILAPKAFSLLVYLIKNKERVVSKRELLDTFWSTNVSDMALHKSISLIRKALGERNRGSIIKTYHGLGYRFVVKI